MELINNILFQELPSPLSSPKNIASLFMLVYNPENILEIPSDWKYMISKKHSLIDDSEKVKERYVGAC